MTEQPDRAKLEARLAEIDETIAFRRSEMRDAPMTLWGERRDIVAQLAALDGDKPCRGCGVLTDGRAHFCPPPTLDSADGQVRPTLYVVLRTDCFPLYKLLRDEAWTNREEARVYSGRFNIPSVVLEIPPTPATGEIERLREAAQLLDRLYTVVAEQQHTLASRGWVMNERHTDDPRGPQWSKAGARKHQYEDVEAAMNDVKAYLDGEHSDHLMTRLLAVKDLAVSACRVGHSTGCNCVCCRVIKAADANPTAAAAIRHSICKGS